MAHIPTTVMVTESLRSPRVRHPGHLATWLLRFVTNIPIAWAHTSCTHIPNPGMWM